MSDVSISKLWIFVNAFIEFIKYEKVEASIEWFERIINMLRLSKPLKT